MAFRYHFSWLKKKGLDVFIWKKKGDHKNLNNYHGSVWAYQTKFLSISCSYGFSVICWNIRNLNSLGLHSVRQQLTASYRSISRRHLIPYTKTHWDLLHLHEILEKIIGLLTGLHSGTVSAMKCGKESVQFLFRERGSETGMRAFSTHLNSCMDEALGKVVNQSPCGASNGNIEINDLVYCWWCSNLSRVTGGSGNDSRGTTWGGKAIVTSDFLAQDQCSSVWRFTRWNSSLLMNVVKTLRSWRNSHTLVVKCISIVDRAK